MKLYSTFAMAFAVLVLAQASSCSQDNFPTADQVYLNLPEEIRNCPYAPKSPGKKATKKQTAVYIAGLYDAWEQCHGDVQVVNKLYKQYAKEVVKANGGICPSPAFCKNL